MMMGRGEIFGASLLISLDVRCTLGSKAAKEREKKKANGSATTTMNEADRHTSFVKRKRTEYYRCRTSDAMNENQAKSSSSSSAQNNE